MKRNGRWISGREKEGWGGEGEGRGRGRKIYSDQKRVIIERSMSEQDRNSPKKNKGVVFDLKYRFSDKAAVCVLVENLLSIHNVPEDGVR